MTAKIKILPDEVAHKIAAGEVIERPASVVKELIENSIDALATQITVEIKRGGLELVRVQDDGIGIARQELEMAFHPHATSKIQSEDDLFSLFTLGFRGEALPSMASVAKLTLVSRPQAQEHGYKIFKKGSEFVIEPIGSPPGTVVEVRDLFFNVPARFKFLKSEIAERRRVIFTTTNLALAHPHISFRLISQGKTVLSTPGNGRLLDTILLVQGKNVAPDLIKFDSEFSWGKIQGYLGTPRLAKGNRSGQVFVLNGRVIQSPTLRAALEKAYHGLLPGRSFPWALLLVEIDPALVDCNVHPAKAEVRFAQEQTLFSDISSAVRSGLASQNLAPSLRQASSDWRNIPKPKPIIQAQLQWQPETWENVDKLLRQYKPRRGQAVDHYSQAGFGSPSVIKETFEPQKPGAGLEEVRRVLLSARILGQLHQTYILLEAPNGLWLLDQHIVHERILLEKLKQDWDQAKIQVQAILPQVLEFSPSEAALVLDSLQKLKEFGLELEDFGSNSFLLRTVPSVVRPASGNWQKEILEIAESSQKTTNWQEDALISLACKGAIKAGEYLDQQIIKVLLADLAQTENPFTCPHGRPIIVILDDKELMRRFGRT
ncbi:MAG: DNA mismatch repair endonuclease MutL [Firmicutes bacterium]|nr:DNA mismatch repair endonuclease MutL [Bacillota bacterium]